LVRFDRFQEVFLDFAGVPFIGQAFADEIFRVFKNQHPDIHLVWINANPDVEKMILRGKGTRTEEAPSRPTDLPWDFSVPCPGKEKGKEICKGRFPLEALRQFKTKGKTEVSCNFCYEDFNIEKLMKGFQSPESE